MLFWHDFVVAFSGGKVLCGSLSMLQLRLSLQEGPTYLELIIEGFIIKEDPRIVVLPIPPKLQLSHTLHQAG